MYTKTCGDRGMHWFSQGDTCACGQVPARLLSTPSCSCGGGRLDPPVHDPECRSVIWAKDRIGTGYWARNAHEHLLIGTKGNVPAPAPGTQPSSVMTVKPSGHSKKPEIFHEIIEGIFPSLPKLELFARRPRPGWKVWGNEV